MLNENTLFRSTRHYNAVNSFKVLNVFSTHKFQYTVKLQQRSTIIDQPMLSMYHSHEFRMFYIFAVCEDDCGNNLCYILTIH